MQGMGAARKLLAGYLPYCQTTSFCFRTLQKSIIMVDFLIRSLTMTVL